jgi:hypothetical protein
MHGTGQYTISDLAELFSISRPTVYQTRSSVPFDHHFYLSERKQIGPFA